MLSVIVGWQMAILSLVAGALSLIEWRVARMGNAHYALQSATLLGLGWLAGHSAFASITLTSLILACCHALAYQGALYFAQEDVQPGDRDTDRGHGISWPLLLLYAGQGAALALLILLGRPLAATLLGALLAPQLLLLSGLDAGAPSTRRLYIRRAIPFMMTAMLIAAWAMPA
jgi:hypothetical protein